MPKTKLNKGFSEAVVTSGKLITKPKPESSKGSPEAVTSPD